MTATSSPRVAAIVGPTAAGKTALSLEVAQRLGAEIVSVDSMQMYRGMDVGTDKIPVEERARVPHHLIDVKDPSEQLTVAEFQRLARAAIEDIAGRGRLPLLVGGSGLYLRAAIDDLRFPPHAGEVRAALEAEARRVGARRLHARLAERDPVAAGRIEPDNARRTIRALEVIELTGRRFSDDDSWNSYVSVYRVSIAGITRERAELYARISDRVARMLERGFLEEVDRLRKSGIGVTARQALGYRQVLEAQGDPSIDELRDRIVRATKRFARRQEAWFEADPRITWFEASTPSLVDDVVALFRQQLELP